MKPVAEVVGIINEFEFETRHPPLRLLPASPTYFFPLCRSFHEGRTRSHSNLGNTIIPVDSDGLYNEIVTRFWHRDLTRKFELELVTGKMDLVAVVERDSDKVFQVRIGGGRAGQTIELGHAKAVSVRFFFGFVFMPPLTGLTGGRIFTGGEGVRMDMEEPQTMYSGEAPSDVHAHP
jgi:hypothetical protein